MNARRCAEISAQAFDQYFDSVHRGISSGAIAAGIPDWGPSFPQTLILTELPNQLAVELVGARRSPRSLKVVKHKLQDPGQLLGQFEHPPGHGAAFHAAGLGQSVKDMALTTPSATTEMNRRFPGFLDLWPMHLAYVGAGPDERCRLIQMPTSSGSRTCYLSTRP